MQYRRPLRRNLNGIFLLDKPSGMSSHEAMLAVRTIFNAEKAGHTGTLDPLATGLLPICFGKVTSLSGHLLNASKRYLAEVRFGTRTSTGDAAGEVQATSDPSALTEQLLLKSLPAFTGRISQVPPMYSALKKDGVRLHKLARQGVEVEREAREIEIEALSLVAFDGHQATLDVRCSKGTYIRTLAEDWAASLGQAAHLSGLRRTQVGPFGADVGPQAVPLASLENQSIASLDEHLLPAQAALAGWRFVTVADANIVLLDQGRTVQLFDDEAAAGPVAVQSRQGGLLGLGVVTEYGFLQPRRWFGPPGI